MALAIALMLDVSHALGLMFAAVDAWPTWASLPGRILLYILLGGALLIVALEALEVRKRWLRRVDAWVGAGESRRPPKPTGAGRRREPADGDRDL
jgi:hypothetical protein